MAIRIAFHNENGQTSRDATPEEELVLQSQYIIDDERNAILEAKLTKASASQALPDDTPVTMKDLKALGLI